MITDQDIEKLKQVFATKDDLEKFATKEDLNRFVTIEYFDDQKDKIVKEIFKILGEMEQRLVIRMDDKFAQQDEKFDKRFAQLNERLDVTNAKLDLTIKRMDERFEQNDRWNRHQDEKFYRLLAEIHGHEKPFQRIETKLFPAP